MRCHTFAGQSRQTLRTAVARYQSEVDLRLPELRVLARDAYVAGHGKLAAAPERESIDRHHDRFPETLDLTRDALPSAGLLGPGAGRAQCVELGDVSSRGEGLLSGAGDDDDADFVVALHVAQCRRELVQEPRAQRVENAWTVKRNEAKRLFDRDEDIFKWHV